MVRKQEARNEAQNMWSVDDIWFTWLANSLTMFNLYDINIYKHHMNMLHVWYIDYKDAHV